MRTLVCLGLLAPTAALAVPTTMVHQGRLLDESGAPINGSRVVDAHLYADAADTSPDWTESQTVTVQDGFYMVVLGDTNLALTPSFLQERPAAEVGIEVDGVELSRAPLNSVPFAMVAGSAPSAMPAGAITAFATGVGTAPEGWLLCDGSEVSRATYAALFAVIGETYGAGDGSTTFLLPDFRGRFLRGHGGHSLDYGQPQESRNAFERARIVWNEHWGSGNTFNQDWGLGHGTTAIEGWASSYPNDHGDYGRPVWRATLGISALDTDASVNGGLYGKGYNDVYAAIGVTGWSSSATLDKSPESRPDNYAVDYLIKY